MCQLCAFRHFLGVFHKFCFNVQTCHHIGGGGYVYISVYVCVFLFVYVYIYL